MLMQSSAIEYFSTFLLKAPLRNTQNINLLKSLDVLFFDFYSKQGCKLNPKEFSVCNVYLDKDASDVKVKCLKPTLYSQGDQKD